MASINAKHFYRFNYLKSDHWSNLRLEKMAAVDACCRFCKVRDLSNDVHHLNYRKLYDVTLEDLVVLCRKCHELAHDAIEKHRAFVKPKGKNSSWANTKKAILAIQRGMPGADNPSWKQWRIDHPKVKATIPVPTPKPSPSAPQQKPPNLRKLAKKRARQIAMQCPAVRILFAELRRVRFWE